MNKEERPRCSHGVVWPDDFCEVCLKEKFEKAKALYLETIERAKMAEARRLLEQSVETLTAAHVDCPGYEVIAAQTEQTFLKMRELARLGREHAAEARRLLQRALAESEMPHDIHCLALPGKCWCWVKDARAHLAGGER